MRPRKPSCIGDVTFARLHVVYGYEMLVILVMTGAMGKDEDLLYAAISAPEGDLRAFEKLIEMHRKRILADCQHMTRDSNNAEDLAQEVFVKAYFALRRFEGRSSFRHWLHRIKVNHCLNHLKNQQGRETLASEHETEEGDDSNLFVVSPIAETDLLAMEERARIHFILEAMPDTLRLPLVMREMDELSYGEIAEALGIGLSAVKMRIKRAREYFRRVYVTDNTVAEGGSLS